MISDGDYVGVVPEGVVVEMVIGIAVDVDGVKDRVFVGTVSVEDGDRTGPVPSEDTEVKSVVVTVVSTVTRYHQFDVWNSRSRGVWFSFSNVLVSVVRTTETGVSGGFDIVV